MCTDPFLCRGSSESCVVDISFHLIKIRLKIAAASAAVGRSRAGRGHAPRAGIAACGYRYRNARLQLPTPLAVTPVSHSRRTRGDISGIPSSDSNLHDFAFRLSDFSASAHLRPRSRLARPAGPDRADPECRERTECRVAGVVNRSPRGTHDTRKHTFTATVTDKSRGDHSRTR